jgi:hypothetical protein
MSDTARCRARCTFAIVMLAWIASVVSMSGLFIFETPTGAKLVTPRYAAVFVFTVICFVLLSVAVFYVVWFSMRELEGLKFKPMYIICLAAFLMQVIGVCVGSLPESDSLGVPVQWGYGYGFLYLAGIAAFFAAYFAFITDRELGNI